MIRLAEHSVFGDDPIVYSRAVMQQYHSYTLLQYHLLSRCFLRALAEPPNTSYTLDDNIIPFTDSQRDLGIID